MWRGGLRGLISIQLKTPELAMQGWDRTAVLRWPVLRWSVPIHSRKLYRFSSPSLRIEPATNSWSRSDVA
jgi:hypothetical protein